MSRGPADSPFRPPRLTRALLDRLLAGQPRAHELREDLLEVCRAEARRRGHRAARRRYRGEALGLLRWRLGRARPLAPVTETALARGVLHDVRHGVRALRRRPRTTGLAVGLLAMGVGVSAAMFSLLEAVVLRPLRLPEPQQVVRLQYGGPAARFHFYLSGPDFEQIRTELTRGAQGGADAPFDDLVAIGGWLPTLVADSGARRVWAGRASPWIFRTLGVAPVVGRDFTPEDVGGDAVILGHALWQSAFGGEPGVVGRRIEMPPRTYTVIGVLPADVDLPAGYELWTTLDLGAAPWMRDRQVRPFLVYGRIAADVRLATARTRVDDVSERIAAEHPESNEGLSVDVVPLRETIAAPVAQPLTLLLGAVLMVLMVACANVAHLLLATGVARSREFATHLALGSTRGRLVRRMLVESTLIAVAGGAAGVTIAAAALGTIRRLAPPEVPRLDGLAINGTVLGFAVLVAATAALGAGLAPALRAAAGASPADRMRGGRSAGRERPGRILLVAEFAVSAVLLLGAFLFVRSLVHLGGLDLGLRPDGFQVFQAAVTAGRDGASTTDEIRERLESFGDIERVVATSHAPLSGAYMNAPILLRDEAVPGIDRSQVAIRMVTPEYFDALSIELRRGRILRPADRADARRVAVVNESAARLLWQGEEPLGRQVALADAPADESGWLEVVGVVADVRQSGPGAPAMPAIYVPHAQAGQAWNWTGGTMAFLLRPTGGTPIAESRIRDAVREVGEDIAVYGVTTLEAHLDASVAGARFVAHLLQIFSLVAFVLAAAGIYGVVSFGVRRRTRDIAIRLALGADAARVRRDVVGEAVRLAAAGAVAGLAVALLAGRWFSGMLHGVTPGDVPTHVLTAGALVAAAVIAAWTPARAASRLDPAEALRTD